MFHLFQVYIKHLAISIRVLLKIDEKLCKNKDFCGIAFPTQKNNTLKFNQYMTSDKTPCIIYADLESLIEKIDNCKNNPEKSSTTKIGKHILCAYSISTISTFVFH